MFLRNYLGEYPHLYVINTQCCPVNFSLCPAAACSSSIRFKPQYFYGLICIFCLGLQVSDRDNVNLAAEGKQFLIKTQNAAVSHWGLDVPQEIKTPEP